MWNGATGMISQARRAAVCIAAALVLAATPLRTLPSAVDGSKIWIGRYAEYEAFLKSAAFERFDDIDVGVTRPRHGLFAPGGLAAGATVKRLPPGRNRGFYESYKSEIAAYKLDRLLQLDMVPPTVERRGGGGLRSGPLWGEDGRTSKENPSGEGHAPDRAGLHPRGG